MPSVKIENADANNAITVYQQIGDGERQQTMGGGNVRSLFIPPGGIRLAAGAPVSVNLTADPGGDVAVSTPAGEGILAAGAFMTLEIGPDGPVTLSAAPKAKKAG